MRSELDCREAALRTRTLCHGPPALPESAAAATVQDAARKHGPCPPHRRDTGGTDGLIGEEAATVGPEPPREGAILRREVEGEFVFRVAEISSADRSLTA
jgi:hypothetical protein